MGALDTSIPISSVPICIQALFHPYHSFSRALDLLLIPVLFIQLVRPTNGRKYPRCRHGDWEWRWQSSADSCTPLADLMELPRSTRSSVMILEQTDGRPLRPWGPEENIWVWLNLNRLAHRVTCLNLCHRFSDSFMHRP